MRVQEVHANCPVKNRLAQLSDGERETNPYALEPGTSLQKQEKISHPTMLRLPKLPFPVLSTNQLFELISFVAPPELSILITLPVVPL